MGGGVPTLDGGGVPTLDGGRVPNLNRGRGRGYLRWTGHAAGGTHLAASCRTFLC